MHGIPLFLPLLCLFYPFSYSFPFSFLLSPFFFPCFSLSFPPFISKIFFPPNEFVLHSIFRHLHNNGTVYSFLSFSDGFVIVDSPGPLAGGYDGGDRRSCDRHLIPSPSSQARHSLPSPVHRPGKNVNLLTAEHSSPATSRVVDAFERHHTSAACRNMSILLSSRVPTATALSFRIFMYLPAYLANKICSFFEIELWIEY
jgi:hypothetical protein